MAEDTTGGISLYLEIPAEHVQLLAPIRHYEGLRAAGSDGVFWVRGFTHEMAESTALKTIPYKKLYHEKNGLLFPQGSLLPQRKMPQGLLWSPFERLLPVTLPPVNYNYFGLQEEVTFPIVKQQAERVAVGLLCSLPDLEKYLITAPAVRLQTLQWIGVDDKALILGTPLLPIQGTALWSNGVMLYPAGYGPQLPLLEEVVLKAVNPSGHSFLLWDKDGSYIIIKQSECMPLSLGAFRLTYK